MQARVAEVIPNGYFIDWDDGAKKKRHFLSQLYIKTMIFTKTGSGQT